MNGIILHIVSPKYQVSVTSCNNVDGRHTKMNVEQICQKVILEYIFPSVSEWFFIIINSILFLSGLLGNALVCFVIWRSLRCFYRC
jgi:hypothetical protein